jgi:hypothetical protein
MGKIASDTKKLSVIEISKKKAAPVLAVAALYIR